jgi:hypothetical protein
MVVLPDASKPPKITLFFWWLCLFPIFILFIFYIYINLIIKSESENYNINEIIFYNLFLIFKSKYWTVLFIFSTLFIFIIFLIFSRLFTIFCFLWSFAYIFELFSLFFCSYLIRHNFRSCCLSLLFLMRFLFFRLFLFFLWFMFFFFFYFLSFFWLLLFFIRILLASWSCIRSTTFWRNSTCCLFLLFLLNCFVRLNW